MVMGDLDMNTDLLVIGCGPAGYGAAFRGADLGLDVIMVDPKSQPGGGWLHESCIPSKTFLHLAELIRNAEHAENLGVNFGKATIDIEALLRWKETVTASIAENLTTLADQRGVLFVQGKARFESSTSARLEGSEISRILFKHAIIATGSSPLGLQAVPFIPGGQVMDSTEALTLPDIPSKMLVVGGDYIGLELGSIYASFGSSVTLAENENRLLPGVDEDLVQPLQQKLSELFEDVLLETQVESAKVEAEKVTVELRQGEKVINSQFDRVLVAVGRIPNSEDLGLENTSVNLDQHGFIQVNDQGQTSDERIFTAGDVAGGAMLAHKATREGRVVAEVICGIKSTFDFLAIPAVVYTDPQICWCGLTEEQAKAENIPYLVQKFPWQYTGRAQIIRATDGFTKLLTDPHTGRILGAGITGRNGETLLGELALAIEMGALAEDLALTLHPHPTLSETIMVAGEIFMGSPTHLIPIKKPTDS